MFNRYLKIGPILSTFEMSFFVLSFELWFTLFSFNQINACGTVDPDKLYQFASQYCEVEGLNSEVSYLLSFWDKTIFVKVTSDECGSLEIQNCIFQCHTANAG